MSSYFTKHLIILLQVADLVIFFVILSVFLISFGIAFQSILGPNQPPSWNLLADLLWRPYWQMFGELFVEDSDLGEIYFLRCGL